VNSRWVSPCRDRRTSRPVPGHIWASRSARTEPVIRKRPGRGSSSTARFTAPRTPGTTCHSSNRIGSSSPRSAASGSARKAPASASRSRRTTVAACLRAVVVFPEARGPVIITAGSSESSRGSESSEASDVGSSHAEDTACHRVQCRSTTRPSAVLPPCRPQACMNPADGSPRCRSRWHLGPVGLRHGYGVRTYRRPWSPWCAPDRPFRLAHRAAQRLLGGG
jgi:hypothetical protein